MKKTALLLAIGLALTAAGFGQSGTSAQWSRKSLTTTVKDSIATGYDISKRTYHPAPGLKTPRVYTHKMDSMLVRRYNADTAGLRTLNQSWCKYDSKGRAVLIEMYTCNTMDGEYRWMKDTLSYLADYKPLLEEHYERVNVTDPWELQYRSTTAYDSHNRDTATTYYGRNWQTGEWVARKNTYVYDAESLVTSSLYQELDTVTGAWVTLSRTENTWDSGRNLISADEYSWLAVKGDWVHSGHREYMYDAGGRQTSSVSYFYAEDDSMWKGIWRQETAYNSLGLPTLVTDFTWEWTANSWVPVSKIAMAYSPEGKETESAYYNWDPETSGFLPVMKSTWTYNAGGLVTETVNYQWDIVKSEWSAEFRDLDSYDPNGCNILSTSERYNAETSTWLENSRTERTFDSFGDLMTNLDMGAKDDAGNWTRKFDATYTYDYSVGFRDAASPYEWSGTEPAWAMVKGVGRRWASDTGQWIDFMSSEYWYSDFEGASGIPAVSLQAVRVFPNPATDVITVEMDPAPEPAQFKLMDPSGKFVAARIVTGGQARISLAGLQSGIYLYTVTRNGETVSGKILKQ
jgi:hypothetical protein